MNKWNSSLEKMHKHQNGTVSTLLPNKNDNTGQDQVITTKHYQSFIVKDNTFPDDKCRLRNIQGND